MATSYFIRKGGSDAANGLTPATAWLTIQKAHNAAAGPTGGDFVYVGAGTYREVVTANMTSPTSELQFTADTDGAHTGDAGPVIWTAYLTNDKTAPSASPLLTLSGKDFLTYQGFYFAGGTNVINIIDASTTLSTNVTLRYCTFWPAVNSTNQVRVVGTAPNALNWLIDSCIFWVGNSGTAVYVTAPTSGGGSDYDLNFIFRNNVVKGGPALALFFADTSGALANKPGGIIWQNNTLFGGSVGLQLSGANYSTTTFPCKAVNNWLAGQLTGLSAGASGQITEDYNLIQAATARSNVTAGANSIATFAYCALPDLGYNALNGFARRLYSEPRPGSALLGFGNQASAPAPPATDLLRRPKPAGGGSTANSIGALELHDTAVQETSVTDAGASGLKISGPGDHDLVIPVNAVATVISVRVRYDTNHGTGSKPQAILQANGQVGVTTETKTATAGVDTWETLTFSSQTPTAKGFVTVRLVSRAAAGNGIAYFDTATVPSIDTEGFDYFRYGEPFPAITGASAGGMLVHPGMGGGVRG